MYNAHRGMMPHQVPNNRLAELFDQIRQEFENHAGRAGDYELQRERETLMNQHAADITLMRDKFFQLEQQHNAVKENYDKQIKQLQEELNGRGGPSGHVGHGGPQHGGPGQPQAPSIGHGPNNLFGGIMQGAGGQAGSLAPPPQEPPQGHQGLPAHLTQGAAMNTGPQPPQQQPPAFGGYQGGPGVNGYGPQGPQPTSSPGPGRGRGGRGPPGSGTPSQNHPTAYGGSPRNAHVPTPPPGQRAPMPPQNNLPNVGNQLSQLSPQDLPPQFKKEGDDWWAVFNPQVHRQLDINLLHTLNHDSVVCCVRFSADGRYVATGCNRAAQIFEVDSGQLISQLIDDSTADKSGDLYIRSVCFSPDGKYLATGAEDKIIRVWDIGAREIKAHFTGHEQDIYSLDFARNGRTIASGSGDKTVRLWDLETKSSLLVLHIEDGVTTVALSGDGRLVAAGSLDRSVRVWDADSGTPLDRLDGTNGHEDSVYSVAFSPSGRELVSGSLDRTIKLWELTTPPARGTAPGMMPKSTAKCIRTFSGHADFVLSVALTPDGAWVLSGSKDRGVQFWDPQTGITQLHLQGHRNSVISVAPSPKGNVFATGSGDQKARIWSYETYRG